jgi:hypothetical protein
MLCARPFRREAHHIHARAFSGKLALSKSLIPEAQSVFPLEMRTLRPQAVEKRSVKAGTGCAKACACANRRPGWFCSLGSAVLADLELATSTITLPAQASLFQPGRGCPLPLSHLRRLSQADRRPS